MFLKKTHLVFLFLFSVAGCTSCYKPPNSEATDSMNDTGSETHSESASQTELDTDSESDSETHISTDTDTGHTTDAGPWEWEDLPEGEDCGEGCRQLTFGYSVRAMEWDVWEDYLVYVDDYEHVVKIVDLKELKVMRIPDVYQEYPTTPGMGTASGMFSPSIYRTTINYALYISDSSPIRDELISVDLINKNQTRIWRRDLVGETHFVPIYIDSHGDRIVSQGGAGNPEYRTLSYYPKPWPTQGVALIDDFYGADNSIWEDKLVFWDHRSEYHNITGYDFTNQEFFDVAGTTEHQTSPRIHKDKVVYMDFRHGESDPLGTWANSAIYMKDLNGENPPVQITSGEAIAAYPDIHDDIIVWHDSRHCDNPNSKTDWSNVEIYGYNLSTQTEFRITNWPDRAKTQPRIWGDKVFADVKTSLGNSIFMFDLPG